MYICFKVHKSKSNKPLIRKKVCDALQSQDDQPTKIYRVQKYKTPQTSATPF